MPVLELDYPRGSLSLISLSLLSSLLLCCCYTPSSEVAAVRRATGARSGTPGGAD